MDSRLTQFNSAATYDDGSCPAIYVGCTDPGAYNYRRLANVDDGACAYAGCMDRTATNYVPKASLPLLCILPIFGCTSVTSVNFVRTATSDDGNCLHPGCTDSTLDGYDPLADVDDGSCSPIFYGCTGLLSNSRVQGTGRRVQGTWYMFSLQLEGI